jgi:cell division protein FtsN
MISYKWLRMAQRKPRSQSTTKKKPTRSATRKNVRKKTSNKAPLWAWIVIGLLLAALIYLLIHLSKQKQEQQTAITAPAPEKSETQVQNINKTPQPRFDFYRILKEREVEVPDRSAEIAAKTPENLIYFLQAGSFRSEDDAEQLRAELILADLEATIETVTSKGVEWHRVVVGPFDNRSKMAAARSTLASKQLSPLVLKR